MVAKIYRRAASWPQRKGGSGYMGISLYSSSHSGAGLGHMVEWINAESGFSFLRVGLSDTLNRFNESGPDPRATARAAGEGWLADNRATLARLQVPYELIRWDHWEQTRPEAVERNRRYYADAFQTVPAFRRAMLADMERFCQRRYGQQLDRANFQRLHDYLVEEVAVYEEIYRDFPNTTIYPANQLNVTEFLRSANLSETFPLTRFERLYIPVQKPAPAPTLVA